MALRGLLPDLDITHKRTLLKSDINARLKEFLSDVDPAAGSYLSNALSHIRPDGGLVWLTLRGRRHLLGAVEAKKQGTNDARAVTGKRKQSKGNAIERASKNFQEIRCHQIGEDIFPFSMFVTGCDLEEGSSILDRLTCLTLGGPFNRLTVRKVKGEPRASIFSSSDPAFMETIILQMLSESVSYYRSKY